MPLKYKQYTQKYYTYRLKFRLSRVYVRTSSVLHCRIPVLINIMQIFTVWLQEIQISDLGYRLLIYVSLIFHEKIRNGWTLILKVENWTNFVLETIWPETNETY